MIVYIIYSLRFNVVQGIYKTLEAAKSNLPDSRIYIKNKIVIKEMSINGDLTEDFTDVVWTYETQD